MASFRTNRGRCILDEENLYLSSSWSGLFRRYWEGGVLGKIMIAILLAGPVVILATTLTSSSQVLLKGYGIGIGLGALLIGIIFIVNRLRGFSYDTVIPREKINSIKLVEGTEGLSQPRFIIKYDKNGKERNRYIVMPSKLLDYGEEELESAKELLKDEGFEVKE